MKIQIYCKSGGLPVSVKQNAEFRTMTSRRVENVCVLISSEPDLDVSRPEYLDTVLVRFENGKYSANGGSPAIMAVLRGLNAKINYESIKRLQAITAGMESSGSVKLVVS